MKIFDFLTIALCILQIVIAEVQIIHPKDLKQLLGNDGYIRSSLGNFGHIVYGSSVVIDFV